MEKVFAGSAWLVFHFDFLSASDPWKQNIPTDFTLCPAC